MAAAPFGSAGGFSYAQAARGQTAASASQANSGKTTSTTTTPPSLANGSASEGGQKQSWAEEVEGSSTAAKPTETSKPPIDSQQPAQSQPLPADRAKPEEKQSNGVSEISSPDLTAASSIATKEDGSVSPRNGTPSDSTWDTRSTPSEPAWIAERKERQSASRTREVSNKEEPTGEAKPKDFPIRSLQEAAPPTINPWTKRAEEAKAKAVALPRSAVPIPSASHVTSNEDLQSRADTRKKAEFPANGSTETTRSDTSKSKPAEDRRPLSNGVQHNGSPKQNGTEKPTDTALTNGVTAAPIASAKKQSTAPSPLSALSTDAASWPTPETAEKNRKDSSGKDIDEKRVDDGAPTMKAKKTEWKAVPITPNVIFQTMPEPPKGKTRGSSSVERGGKASSGSGRGRGGHRGASHTNGGDRQTIRNGTPPTKHGSDPYVDVQAQDAGSDRQSAAKPIRASSTNSYRDRRPENIVVPEENGTSVLNGKLDGKGPHVTGKIEEGAEDALGLTKPAYDSHRPKQTIPDSKSSTIGATADDFVPKPIPQQRSSSGSRPQRATEAGESNGRAGATPLRSAPADSRRDTRQAQPPREQTWTAPRSNKRGGRGRGGNDSREPVNGHQGNHAYQANYTPEFAPSYNAPQSPYGASPRGHHQFAYPSVNRGGWTGRGGMRSQSIPIDNTFYPRMSYMSNGGPAPPHSMSSYMPNMYDPNNAMPMTAMPYPTQMDVNMLVEMVTTQLDYYFSLDNLLKDMFLREHMDSQGFVLLDVIAKFNRVQSLTQDKELIKHACMLSQEIEIVIGEDGKERLRRANDWQKFLLPVEQRKESAQNDGPEQLRHLDRLPLTMASPFTPFRGPASAGLPPSQFPRYDRRSYDSAYTLINGAHGQYATYNGISEIVHGDSPNGEELRGRAARSPMHETPISPISHAMENAASETDGEPDAFHDSQVDVLTVVVKMQNPPASQAQSPSYHSLSSRTFSNGSIDSRSIMSEMDKPSEGSSPTKKEDQTNANGTEVHLPPIPRRASPNKAESSDRSNKDTNLDVFWVKDQEGPVPNLLPGLTTEPYIQLRLKALDQRNHAATGNCPYDMDVLYQFWCHFLIRNFNSRMYAEFKTYAHEDVKRTNYTGVHNLLKFYAQALSSPNPIRDRVVKDYMELVQDEPAALQGAAFKQLRSAWRNGALNLKNRKKLADLVDGQLKAQLDGPDA